MHEALFVLTEPRERNLVGEVQRAPADDLDVIIRESRPEGALPYPIFPTLPLPQHRADVARLSFPVTGGLRLG